MIKIKNEKKGSEILRILFFIYVLLFADVTFAGEEEISPCYLSTLINQAVTDTLYERIYWHTLLHYRKSLFRTVSQIDDPAFFLSPDGKFDPKAELLATLEAFFRKSHSDQEHPRCRFIARYQWLKSELNIDEARLPPVHCTQYEALMEQVMPEKAVLVFPAAYMNNPASMFGHTLLNIQPRESSSLVSNSVNYSARTTVQNGIVFAFKGVFGFYNGYYEVLPYYARIQLYSDINQRDIWEYTLNLSPEEIENMIRHIWELREVYSKYYFFNENCSYNLLFLLDAAKPSLNLTGKFGGYVIPLDTIRAVDRAGLVESVNYRPSKATKIHHIKNLLPNDLRKLALAVGNLEKQPDTVLTQNLSNDETRHVIDLATEFIQHRYFKKEIDQSVYRKSFLDLLKVRSRISGLEDSDYNIPAPSAPETGHRTKRLTLGIEFEDNKFYTNLGIRPAYHDLLDPHAGYSEGSEIEFLDIKLQYDPADEKIELKRLNIINIVALSPRDLFFKPISWKLQTGVVRTKLEDEERHSVFFLTTGQGLTWKVQRNANLYGVAEAEFISGRGLNPDYAFGVGGTVGILAGMSEWWKVHLFGRGITFVVGDSHSKSSLNFEQRFRFTSNVGVNLVVSRERTFDLYDTIISADINFYF